VDERMTVRVHAAAPALLIVSDAFYPGWRAWVDGRAAPIFPAHILFRGVFVPAGEHVVTFRYQPAGFRVGVNVSLAAAVIALTLLRFLPRRQAGMTPLDDGPPGRARRWMVVAFVVILLVSAAVMHDAWRSAFPRFGGARAVPAD